MTGLTYFLGICGLLFLYSIPIIIVWKIIAMIVRRVKKRNDRIFHEGLPEGFVEIRRNQIAVNPERGEVLFYPGNHIYSRDQLAGAPTFDIDLEEITVDDRGKLRMPGQQNRFLQTGWDELWVKTADGQIHDFPVEAPYDKTYAVIRRLYYGLLTRDELRAAGFAA